MEVVRPLAPKSDAQVVLTTGEQRPLKLAIVTETFLPKMDGIVRFLLEMLRYLRREGHQAIVFCPGPGDPTALGFPVVRARALPFSPYPELHLAVRSGRMVRLLHRWQPDVVHLAGPVLLGAHGLRVARLLDLPAAGHFQTNLPRYARDYGVPWLAPVAWAYLLALHNRCVANYTPTDIVTNEVRRHGMQRVTTLPRGVDAEAFHPRFRSAAVRAAWGARDDQVIVLYAGRVAPEKNLLKLGDLVANFPKCRFVVVGDGPFLAPLQAHLGAVAHFTGELRGEALSAAFASADLFAFPSLTETFGLVVLEAMASGLPVLAMAAGGVSAMVASGVNGVLCRPERPEDWLDGARQLIASPRRRQHLAAGARTTAESRSWNATFSRLISDYRQIAARNQDRRRCTGA